MIALVRDCFKILTGDHNGTMARLLLDHCALEPQHDFRFLSREVAESRAIFNFFPVLPGGGCRLAEGTLRLRRKRPQMID